MVYRPSFVDDKKMIVSFCIEYGNNTEGGIPPSCFSLEIRFMLIHICI